MERGSGAGHQAVRWQCSVTVRRGQAGGSGGGGARSVQGCTWSETLHFPSSLSSLLETRHMSQVNVIVKSCELQPSVAGAG